MSSLDSGFVQVCLSNSWSGLEMSALDSARMFADAGFKSYLICSPQSELFKRAAEMKAETKVEVVPLRSRDYFSPRAVLALRRFVQDLRPQAIFCHRLRDLWLVRPALLGASGVRLIGFARLHLKRNRKDLLHRWLFGRVDALIALSRAHVGHLVLRLPVRHRRIHVVPSGVDTTQFSPLRRSEEFRRELGAGPQDLLIGCIGRIEPRKGQLELLQAVARLRTFRPELRFKLIFVGTRAPGESDEYERRLHQFCKERALTSCVEFLGHREDIPMITASLDISVVPSYEETFGRVVIEAMASGVPVIATAIGGVPDLIQHGREGWLIRPKRPVPLSEALARLMNDEDLRLRLGRKARETVVSRFSPETVRTRLLSVALNTALPG